MKLNSRAKEIKRQNKRSGTKFKIKEKNTELPIDIGSEMGGTSLYDEPEYGQFQLNTRATKPFISSFFVNSFLNADTKVKGGDLIELSTGLLYLVTTLNKDMLNNEVVRNMAICYKCNSVVLISRKEMIENDETLEDDVTYVEIKDNIDCLVTEGNYGEEIDFSEYGNVSTDIQEMYIQNKVGLELGDRITIKEDENVYGGERILYVRKIRRRFQTGIDYCILVEDE